ncbi:MAG TPA: RdgB/HAM1 family non-canonical purine NTP pyrophosphatase, partial [Mycobacteriales bacterium]|nr:RdgB/HAM1 family non-canonical purine NTP pyrophosphatase [Mycobacteriales bacterium]
VVLATRNAGKLTELRRILEPFGIALLGLDDVTSYEPGPETAPDFAGNALAKAREAVSHTGLPAVADDSGLVVDALNGMPGVLSARWAGRHGDDRANLELVLAQLADVPDERRGARFVCAAAFALPDGREEVVEGTVEGVLLRAPRGSGGFGYDPLFVPQGSERTTAQMTPEDKDAISHRGKAFRSLAPRLAQALQR